MRSTFSAPTTSHRANASNRGHARLYGLLAVFFGLAAVWFALGLAANANRGWVFTTLGISAVGFAIAAARSRAARLEKTGILPRLGGALGVVGTVLCVWSVAAFHLPAIPAVPHISALAIMAPDTVLAETVVDDPAAVVREATSALCAGIRADETTPKALRVAKNGRVIAGSTKYSKLPSGMTLEYAGNRNGMFILTVRDPVLGIAVGCDSTSTTLIDR